MERVSDLLKVTQQDSGQVPRQPVPSSLCFPLHPVAVGGWGWWLSLYEHWVKENRHIFLLCSQVLRNSGWGKKTIEKAFLEGRTGKHGRSILSCKSCSHQENMGKGFFWVFLGGWSLSWIVFPSLLYLFFHPRSLSSAHNTILPFFFSFTELSLCFHTMW